ncbi:hypothetical protein [Exiguobacterium sp. s144]|nr:hypothetical protein [Exiguobacterium sp. s144]
MSRINANANVKVDPIAKLRPYPEAPNGAINKAKIPLAKKKMNEVHYQ